MPILEYVLRRARDVGTCVAVRACAGWVYFGRVYSRVYEGAQPAAAVHKLCVRRVGRSRVALLRHAVDLRAVLATRVSVACSPRHLSQMRCADAGRREQRDAAGVTRK